VTAQFIRGSVEGRLSQREVRVLYKDRVLDCTRFKALPCSPSAEDEKTIDAQIDRLVAAAALAEGTFLLCPDTRFATSFHRGLGELCTSPP